MYIIEFWRGFREELRQYSSTYIVNALVAVLFSTFLLNNPVTKQLFVFLFSQHKSELAYVSSLYFLLIALVPVFAILLLHNRIPQLIQENTLFYILPRITRTNLFLSIITTHLFFFLLLITSAFAYLASQIGSVSYNQFIPAVLFFFSYAAACIALVSLLSIVFRNWSLVATLGVFSILLVFTDTLHHASLFHFLNPSLSSMITDSIGMLTYALLLLAASLFIFRYQEM